MKVLVTGASGFIGSHLVDFLLSKGHDVRVFVTSEAYRKKGVEIVVGDIRSMDDVLQAVTRVDFVFHLAALPIPSYVSGKDAAVREINYLGAKNVVDAIKKAHASGRGLVFASSIKVYGDTTGEMNESSPLLGTSAYALSKKDAEAICRDSGVRAVIFRHSNIYGPGQGRDYLIPHIIAQSLASKTVSVKDAFASADFLFIDDLLDAYEKAMNSSKEGTYNLCSGVATTVEDVVGLLGKIEKKELALVSEMPPGERNQQSFSSEKIKNELLWRPHNPLEQGLAKTLKAYI